MNLMPNVSRDEATGVAVADTPDGLSAIHKSGCAATIWRRQPPSGFQEWIDALSPKKLPQTRIILKPTEVREEIDGLCQASGMPDGPGRLMLIDDIALLADMFAAQMKAAFLQLRLEAISTNACKKFHVDAVSARLICTYRGTGTQYGVSLGGEEPQQIFTVPTGSPILLTGSDWPDHCKSGLLHRSPPIEMTGETRLVLVLDPVQNEEAPL